MQLTTRAAIRHSDDFSENLEESTKIIESPEGASLEDPEIGHVVVPFFTANSIFSRLKAAYGMTSRASQTRLAVLIKEGLMQSAVTCVEAPTGTGKTLGYLAGALEARYRTIPANGGKAPIVVATATVALQNQILTQDIPRLRHIGVLGEMKVSLAKGRGRYFCPRNAQILAEKSAEDSQKDWLDDTKGMVASSEQIVIRTMFQKWREKEWDGDVDHWPDKVPSQWSYSCAASSETCVLKACEHYSECPYLMSRAQISQSDIIIANHDLVIADLISRKFDPKKGTLPFAEYQLILDEAHKFPDKIIETRKSSTNLTQMQWLTELAEHAGLVLRYPQLVKALQSNPETAASSLTDGAEALIEGTFALAQNLEFLDFDDNSVHSWGTHSLPLALSRQSSALSAKVYTLMQTLQLIGKFLSEKGQDAHGSEHGLLIHSLAKNNVYYHAAKELSHGLACFCSEHDLVRWAEKTEQGFMIQTQPMDAGPILDEILWSKEITVMLVSATMQVNGSFERFRNKTNLPARAITEALPPVFDYTRGYLHMPQMKTSPTEKGYEKELVYKIELLLDAHKSKGTLVLFTSRKTMRKVFQTLEPKLQAMVLEQGTKPIPELIETHKRRIDAGESSILFGLDTMAEGLDLPGIYCEQVVITRLPFGNPQDPVEQARQEAMGGSWFANVYLCDMITRLTQACGRLIRRETDKGVITVLDKRLYAKMYGNTAIASLPKFSQCTLIQEYLDNRNSLSGVPG